MFTATDTDTMKLSVINKHLSMCACVFVCGHVNLREHICVYVHMTVRVYVHVWHAY